MTGKNKKIIVVLLSLLLTALVACKKQENYPTPVGTTAPQLKDTKNTDHWNTSNSAPVQKSEYKIVVPATVKGKWKAVKIVVENISTKKTQEYIISLNSDFKVPGSSLKITVGEFLPHFMIEGNTMTSASNDLINPAVAVKIFDGGKQILPSPEKQWGWLWGKKELQAAHSLNNPNYNFILKEAVQK